MQGSGGGPTEGNCSGYLLRSTSKRWAKNSILAVDAGTHLSGIVKILDDHAPNRKNPEASPFEGAPLPGASSKVNAAFITRELVSTYLLTHSHLDHLSGFVINTASFSNTAQPKRVAALPHVINALKTHIFNDVIWPNLSDEDAGVGLLTYQRMQVAHTYIPVSDGLSAQVWAVSHGHCMKLHTHWGRKSSAGLPCDGAHSGHNHQARWCVLDSAVFFVRDDTSGQEVMMWGDVEPDSVSLDPRNLRVWQEAARKFHAGFLSTIFIECSYVNSQPDSQLYGHLSPQHLMTELKVLAEFIVWLRNSGDQRNDKKRKRLSNGYSNDDPLIEGRRRNNPNPPNTVREEDEEDVPPPFGNLLPDTHIMTDNVNLDVNPIAGFPAVNPFGDLRPLEGLQIVITHVKDTMGELDDPMLVLADLEKLEKEANLGCTFVLARQGGSIYF